MSFGFIGAQSQLKWRFGAVQAFTMALRNTKRLIEQCVICKVRGFPACQSRCSGSRRGCLLSLLLFYRDFALDVAGAAFSFQCFVVLSAHNSLLYTRNAVWCEYYESLYASIQSLFVAGGLFAADWRMQFLGHKDEHLATVAIFVSVSPDTGSAFERRHRNGFRIAGGPGPGHD